MRTVAVLLLGALTLMAQSAEEIIRKAETQMRGDTSKATYEMRITTPRWDRVIEMESWSKGKENGFVLITAPKKDRGITFLKLDNEMWQFVPRIERVVKIPPSMMLQSWMGSDFTNDDVVRESSIEDDYHAKILSETEALWRIELVPKEDAAVVWGRLVLDVGKTDYVIRREECYDEENILVRILHMSDIKIFSGRPVATKMVVEPTTEDKKGRSTTFLIKEIVFDEPVDDEIFTKRALKRMSGR